MSEMKSKVVTGDLSVGKNVAVGGRATIQGNTLIKGRLRVEGWLEANNVKVANKGLFETAESLRTSYPHPRDGWWALVGKTLPAPIYVGIGGDWVATGEEGGIAALDSDRYEQFISEVESMMSGIEAAFVQLTETDISHDGKLTSHDAQIAKNELREVKVEVSGNTAKLTISTLGKSVTVALPIATTTGLGLMLGSDKVKLNNAYDIATEAKTTATSAQQTANSATTNISQALSQIASLAGVVASQAQTHTSDISGLRADVDAIEQQMEGQAEDTTALDEAITALSSSVADNIRGLSGDIAGLSITHNTDKTALTEEIDNLKEKDAALDEAIAALQESVTTMSEAYDGLDTSINEHIAEVAIYAFNGDGPPSTSSSAYNGPAGIYYSQSEGLFYKTTSGSPSKSIPHNANGKARTDCLYRKGNVLYQYNGSTLSEYVNPSVAAELAELRSLIANLG